MKENNLLTLFSFIENKEVREKLLLSEERIIKTFNELFSGYALRAEDVLNEVIRVSDFTGIIEVKDINFYSYCEHHFAPFFGKASVYYQPNKIITGLGKIIRLVSDVHARRLQIQEILTKNIAEDVMRVLDAKGAYVVTTAKHLCICSRGPSDDNSETTVAYGCGVMKNWYLAKP